ncbi:Os02g0173300 [Oryza sativa Japonica Group]|uniref:Os02g0173300 protein n=2 Tax=Oryza sativa subsp. japonica TaxID=39947 RepID=Q0E3I6_ORYSJ|nr:Os02g0173300 [Oryza sativa Japonica Group]BAS77220.1 Os02g0173300 [Oryza sativa Japonica Group]|eukprot:NP_001046038.1 Os02g0173300 [Oryza sativa Japonica Group]
MMARNVRLVSVPVICLLTFSAGGGGDGADEAGDLLLPSGTSAPCRRVPPPPPVASMEFLTVRPAMEVGAPGLGARRRPSSILDFGHDGMHVATPALGRRQGISSPSRHDL